MAGKVSEQVVQTLEVALGAAATAYAAVQFGKNGNDYRIGDKVPLAPAIAAGLYAVGLFAVRGKTANHVLNVADGALAGWLSSYAASEALKAKLEKPAAASSSGFYQLGAGPSPYAADRQAMLNWGGLTQVR